MLDEKETQGVEAVQFSHRDMMDDLEKELSCVGKIVMEGGLEELLVAIFVDEDGLHLTSERGLCRAGPGNPDVFCIRRNDGEPDARDVIFISAESPVDTLDGLKDLGFLTNLYELHDCYSDPIDGMPTIIPEHLR